MDVAIKQEMGCSEEMRGDVTGLCLTEQEIKEEVYVIEVCVCVRVCVCMCR